MKMKAGKLYDANYDPELLAERAACADLTYELNQLRPSKAEERDALVRRILGKVNGSCTIVSPFFCDYGYNIEVGENFFANMNCVILDEAAVKPDIRLTQNAETKGWNMRALSRSATMYGLAPESVSCRE